MLHEIDGAFDNHFEPRSPRPHDRILSFRGDSLLMARTGDAVELPTAAWAGTPADALDYLFGIDGTGFFLASAPLAGDGAGTAGGIDSGQVEDDSPTREFRYEPLGAFRWIRPRETRFAIEVAWQLSSWYEGNRFCGRCGARTAADAAERMLRCPLCGNTAYPRINPGVIVGVADGEDLLLTKYAGREYASWALVAGFTEIGESLEQTVAREVLEETGVHVKDIRYFGNQPWPRSSSMLVGFFAELDGPRDVRVDGSELACAEWTNWRDVPHEPDGYSLTRAMMCAFHDRWARSGNPRS